jgi:hypothetical protein
LQKKFQENKEAGYEEEIVNRGQMIKNEEVGEESQISYDEVEEAVNRIRFKKALGGDGMYPELVTHL